MRKALLTAVAVLAFGGVGSAHAAERVTILLAGGPESDTISVSLSPDGSTYVIDSAGPLEVGGNVCTHPEGMETELLCEAAAIIGFEVSAGGGDDSVIVSRDVPAPVTVRGGPGNDHLVGGAGSDRLAAGPGDDVLVGRAGKDTLLGGAGGDRLVGGPDYDVLRGEEGDDVLLGGPGPNLLVQ